ncbi:hypothetical protein [Pseudomonas syringae]|uniref:hypothetical protein n=1 Tax=Pseudomonas syringae TaxID=317 RepID=UPI00200B5C50|nr:hypothetical protein [Pseudomonas syringae]MCK9744389.1 hypothetical protein [Pseudomonas syringae pv. syringae]MCK9768106.1 hypothetical protein [Pseudomonas syringae pv. syringae]
MSRKVTIKENNFLSIFSDAVVLYESALSCTDDVLKNALVKSSILSVNYALEAAANSFLQSLKASERLKKKIDMFSTLDKFDFVLQWHTDHCIVPGDPNVQAVANLISNRNNMVHPKIFKNSAEVLTSVDSEGRISHSIKQKFKSGQDRKRKLLDNDPDYWTELDAKEALIIMTSFLNIYVEDWWGIGFEQAELFLFQTWDGSIHARPVMYREHQIKTLLRHESFLQIRFMGLHGLISD